MTFTPLELVAPTAGSTGWAVGVNANWNQLKAVLGALLPQLSGGRLTLSSTETVPSNDQTATTLYYLAHASSKLALFDPVTSAWGVHDLGSGVSIDNTSLSADQNYDVFAYDDSGSLALELVAWSNGTSRATALSTEAGIRVKSGDASRRYLGTVRTIDDGGTVKFTDSTAQRFVWNNAQRVVRVAAVTDGANVWTYTSGTYRRANGASTSKVELVRGLDDDLVQARVKVATKNTGDQWAGTSGVGVDSTTSNSAQLYGCLTGVSGSVSICEYANHPGIGHRTLNWLEASNGGATQWNNAGHGGLLVLLTA